MSLVLGPLFDQPLHTQPWCDFGRDRGQVPECPRYDYRVTNPFAGIDLVNGGRHNAVDAGNAGMGWTVLAPARVPMRYLHHFDGARGRRWELGNGYVLEAWHVAADAAVDPPRPTKGTAASEPRNFNRGTPVALTGNTGAQVGGKPMPAHTHIALFENGKPIDPEPHLFGAPITGAPNDMQTFSDVPPEHQFYESIEWMVDAGLTSAEGVGGSGEYRPDGLVTRGQLAAFLSRFDRYLAKKETP